MLQASPVLVICGRSPNYAANLRCRRRKHSDGFPRALEGRRLSIRLATNGRRRTGGPTKGLSSAMGGPPSRFSGQRYTWMRWWQPHAIRRIERTNERKKKDRSIGRRNAICDRFSIKSSATYGQYIRHRRGWPPQLTSLLKKTCCCRTIGLQCEYIYRVTGTPKRVWFSSRVIIASRSTVNDSERDGHASWCSPAAEFSTWQNAVACSLVICQAFKTTSSSDEKVAILGLVFRQKTNGAVNQLCSHQRWTAVSR